MASKKTNIPSVLLLLLSALGILFVGTAAALTLISTFIIPTDSLSTTDEIATLSTSVFLFSVSLLNLPTLIISIKKLKKRASLPVTRPLFQKIKYLILIWLLVLASGFLLIRGNKNLFLLAPFTVAAVIIPVWWIIEFSRRGLPRSTKLREWGTLTIGLTITPIIIIFIEMILLIVSALIVMIGLGYQQGLNGQFLSLFENLNLYQGGIGELEQILYELMKYPLISTVIFLTIGFIAPLIEEIFKPMAIWFLLNRPLKEYEGFSLGLISGGAFAILESAGMAIQMDTQDWLIAITLRAATGVLHIGLSGMIGYGLSRSWQQNRFGRGLLYVLTAAFLHGAWNSLALLSGFSSSVLSDTPGVEISSINGTLSLILMIIVFIAIIVITLKINARLRQNLSVSIQEPY